MASLKQQHYRRLMKEQKTKASTKSTQRVDHPLARYNSLNQLSCIVCDVQIKSEILWTTHLHSRKHKDAVLLLKNKKSSLSKQPVQKEDTFLKPLVPPTSKRKHPEVGEEKVPLPKKPRQEQPSSVQATAPSAPSPSVPTPNPTKSADNAKSSFKSTTKHKKSKKKSKTETTAITSSGLPADFFDSGVSKTFREHGEEVFYESSSESEDERPTKASETVQPPPSGVPTDFFDKSSSTKSKKNTNGKGKGALPEGFFDDPKQDAKARKVEYKDPMIEEWEKFQKTIQKEDDVSEALQLEEDEEANEERELTQVNEQVSWFTKAEQLRQRQEALAADKARRLELGKNKSSSEQPSSLANTNEKSDSSDDDDLDFDSLLNWRAKVS